MTVVLLIVIAGLKPRQSTISRYEKERRLASGDSEVKWLAHRDSLIGYVLRLQQIILAILIVVSVALSVAAFGWWLGVILSVVVAAEYQAVAHLRRLQKLSQRLYEGREKRILKYVDRFPGVFKYLGTIEPDHEDELRSLDSREDLQHLIDQSVGILTLEEKKLIVHGLSFSEQLVGSIMTPRSVIDSIKKSEFLGPLTLDELHKTGHSRLPVYDGDIDHIVGVLHLQSLLTLDIKRSVTAEKAMEPSVFYIREDQTLQHALAAFLRTRHHLFIVVNKFRETVGLLTLEDVMEALLGRRIIDEFDAHDDLRAVALRNIHGNNHPENRKDV
jgi:CBS domain containing-hemolysin-like protein